MDSTVYLALKIKNKQVNLRIFTNGPRKRWRTSNTPDAGNATRLAAYSTANVS